MNKLNGFLMGLGRMMAFFVTLAIVAIFAMAMTYPQKVARVAKVFTNTLTVENAATVGGTVTSKGTVWTASNVSLTSPTTTFSAKGLGLVILNADANLTGIKPTQGALGQEIKIISGSGSNTMRFDDSGTSMALGANVTLTEGQSDSLDLVCTSADGDEWAWVGHDN